MPIIPFATLNCPLDGTALRQEGTCWRCTNAHSFDVASQGYTNLLPVQHKRSRDPGDSKEMVAARRRFLEAGHYRPIAAAVGRTTLADLPAEAACLDAGCGEGYYLRQLAAGLGPTQTLAVLGLDISKWAVLAAAKADKRMAWVVGSNAGLPVPDASLDRLLCLFGFPVYSEFARVLKPGGRLVQVDAGPDHLRQLREIIYPRLKEANKANAATPEGFDLLAEERVHFDFTVSGQAAIADLLTMTPHLYRATPEGRARAAALDGLTMTADVRLKVFQRLAGQASPAAQES